MSASVDISYYNNNCGRKMYPEFDYMLNYKSLELGIVRHHFIVVILGFRLCYCSVTPKF